MERSYVTFKVIHTIDKKYFSRVEVMMYLLFVVLLKEEQFVNLLFLTV